MKIIGKTAIYRGTEHPYLTGRKCQIRAILRPELGTDEHIRLETDQEIREAGGLLAGDRAEVVLWLPESQRFSCVSLDPEVEDLGLLWAEYEFVENWT